MNTLSIIILILIIIGIALGIYVLIKALKEEDAFKALDLLAISGILIGTSLLGLVGMLSEM